jgi:hypothetical protein
VPPCCCLDLDPRDARHVVAAISLEPVHYRWPSMLAAWVLTLDEGDVLLTVHVGDSRDRARPIHLFEAVWKMARGHRVALDREQDALGNYRAMARDRDRDHAHALHEGFGQPGRW